ncbi:molybdenum cofactor synthesis protein 2 small subunit [Tieghemostelium lacteum]|uniref:Molybdenum cofactor synthesis protein 2 small subunit n=1 Tax=Tieghemostelium lacteum TaxID=361077 RepID=A0A152A4Z5_TIELA|nr:molybdenum cofactor synthesis protein 2 small subunit [Tieghemostelium lacteum]|eukprot:KYR01309.1 molybdenum cofactor synthesis protein 2 small subunit [Tieghemostelium lacteum]
MSKSIKCLLFAKLKEIFDNNSEITITLPIDKCTTLNLLNEIKSLYPKSIYIINISLVAINCEYIEKDKDVIINENDEVAIIPPVSGG